jgi:hypothetical protein
MGNPAQRLSARAFKGSNEGVGRIERHGKFQIAAPWTADCHPVSAG